MPTAQPDNGYQPPIQAYGYPNPYAMFQPPLMAPPFYPLPQYPQLPHPVPVPAQQAPAAAAPVIYPDIIHWFHYLDKHNDQNKDGLVFVPYGPILKAKGFLWIMQLTLNFFMLKDLADWLGIQVGTAILIMQYAKEDTEAIKAGNLVIPRTNIN
jgi:hypothetical protein